MRIDKFLKVSRVLKRRSVANEACQGNKVYVNGKAVKPSFALKIGDIVELHFGSGTVKFIIKEIKETVKKDEASTLYELINE